MDFAGKVVIVTGASSGIGAATAKLFAERGAFVTAVGRNETRLTEVVSVCEGYHGNRALPVRVDLTQDGGCERVVAKTVETHRRIDVLVNCAGKAVVASLFENTMESFDELVALNLRVPYKLTQLCVPYLKVTKGNIVNVFGSPCRVRPGLLICAMIRDAMQCFTASGGWELGCEGVRMNAVRPGITRTNFLANFNVDADHMETAYRELAYSLPNRAINEPKDVAKMITFLASDGNGNLNGCCLVLDGGASSC